MISIDSSMSDVEQMDAAQAATRPPEMPSADTGKPVGDDTKEPEAAVVEEPETDDEAGDEDAEPVVKKKGGFQRKLERKDQEIATLRAQLEARSTGGQSAEREPQTIVGKPTLTQFDGDLDQFTEALVDWKAEQRANEAEAKLVADTWDTRVSETAKEFDDFEEFAQVEIPLTSQMREFLVDSDLGPKIGYTLAKDLIEAQRIFGLTPVQQVKALAKLELQLAGTLPPPALKQTKASAPPPIKPLAGGSTTSVVKDPRRSEMSFQEFVVWRNSGGK